MPKFDRKPDHNRSSRRPEKNNTSGPKGNEGPDKLPGGNMPPDADPKK